MDKDLKVHDVDKSTLVFGFQYIFLFHPAAQQSKTQKKSWDETVLKMWSKNFEENKLIVP